MTNSRGNFPFNGKYLNSFDTEKILLLNSRIWSGQKWRKLGRKNTTGRKYLTSTNNQDGYLWLVSIFVLFKNCSQETHSLSNQLVKFCCSEGAGVIIRWVVGHLEKVCLSRNISIGLVFLSISHLVHHGIRNTERGKKALRPVDWSRWVHLGEGGDDLKFLWIWAEEFEIALVAAHRGIILHRLIIMIK